MKFRHLAKQKSVTSRTIVFKNSEPKIQLQKFIMILVTVAALYWSWTWVERILRLVPNEEKIDDTQLSADDKGDRKRKLLIARSSSWALEMSRGNTMMLLYVMIKNEISQVKETNVHIPKGDSIPFLSVCPLSSIAHCLKITQKVDAKKYISLFFKYFDLKVIISRILQRCKMRLF